MSSNSRLQFIITNTQGPAGNHAFQVVAAVVTCGGLCPGLNDVVQNIVYTLRDHGVPEDNILGIK